MRTAVVCAVLLAGCARPAANPYPEAARQEFAQTCWGDEAFCNCAWEGLIRAMTAEEYQAAQARFRVEGVMDPRIVRVRTKCVEQAS